MKQQFEQHIHADFYNYGYVSDPNATAEIFNEYAKSKGVKPIDHSFRRENITADPNASNRLLPSHT
jgi:hypothetical protein